MAGAETIWVAVPRRGDGWDYLGGIFKAAGKAIWVAVLRLCGLMLFGCLRLFGFPLPATYIVVVVAVAAVVATAVVFLSHAASILLAGAVKKHLDGKWE